MIRTVHLIRHASYGMLGVGLAGRRPGLSLDDQGRAEAAQVAAGYLSARPVVAVVSSPRERARETAEPLAARLGHPVIVDEGFDEIDFGDWTGRTFDSLHAEPAWQAWNRFRGTATVPGGETMHAAQARALASVQRLPIGEVVVVSHSDVIKALLVHWMGAPLDLIGRIEIAPASRSAIRLFEDDVRVDAVNRPPGA